MPAIMFHIIHHVAWYLLEAFWDGCALTKVLVHVVLLQLGDLKFLSILPLGVPVLLVDEDVG